MTAILVIITVVLGCAISYHLGRVATDELKRNEVWQEGYDSGARDARQKLRRTMRAALLQIAEDFRDDS